MLPRLLFVPEKKAESPTTNAPALRSFKVAKALLKSRSEQMTCLLLGRIVVGIKKVANSADFRHHLVQKVKPLANKFTGHEGDACNVTARATEASNKAILL